MFSVEAFVDRTYPSTATPHVVPGVRFWATKRAYIVGPTVANPTTTFDRSTRSVMWSVGWVADCSTGRVVAVTGVPPLNVTLETHPCHARSAS